MPDSPAQPTAIEEIVHLIRGHLVTREQGIALIEQYTEAVAKLTALNFIERRVSA